MDATIADVLNLYLRIKHLIFLSLLKVELDHLFRATTNMLGLAIPLKYQIDLNCNSTEEESIFY